MAHTVAFHTLGCKLNFSESSTIARQLAQEGFERVDPKAISDVYVINTCSVTERADSQCRSIVRQCLRKNPNAFVAVIGCYAQLKPESIVCIPGVDVVLGANEKFNLSKYLGNLEKKTEVGIHSCEIKDVKEFVPSFSSADRTRTFLKVQDGCDYFCSFCTIPLARGRSRSTSIAETLKEAQLAASSGAKEIVLTGVNIGDFGAGTDENFLGLAKNLDNINDVDRFRISSIEPNLLSNETIDFVSKSNKFVPHFHIPLQSGNDELLSRMRRRYDTSLYRSRIERIKEVMPDACIGVDVIVGFPGETEERFMDTYNFLNELPISYLHVFTYSERPNTTAIRMTEDVVPVDARKERNRMLTILSEKKKHAFYRQFENENRPVLFEKENKDGMMFGFTDNYLRVSVPYEESHANTVRSVDLQGLSENVFKTTVNSNTAIAV